MKPRLKLCMQDYFCEYNYLDYVGNGAYDNEASSIEVAGGQDCVAVVYGDPLDINGNATG